MLSAKEMAEKSLALKMAHDEVLFGRCNAEMRSLIRKIEAALTDVDNYKTRWIDVTSLWLVYPDLWKDLDWNNEDWQRFLEELQTLGYTISIFTKDYEPLKPPTRITISWENQYNRLEQKGLGKQS